MGFKVQFSLIVGLCLGLAACQESDSDRSIHFPPSAHIHLLQVSLTALPGVHMDGVKAAFDKQQSPRCQLEESEENGGLKLEVLSGELCPLRVEYEQYGNAVDFETGVIRFSENIMYLERANGLKTQAGVELHSQFEFHMDMESAHAQPKKVVVSSRGKHLVLGKLNLMGEVRFDKNDRGESKRVLDYMIANDQVSSRVEIDFEIGAFRVDGMDVKVDKNTDLFRFTSEPDLNIEFIRP